MKHLKAIVFAAFLSGGLPVMAQSTRVLEKAARLRTDDPHGIAITLLSMGIVFACLALLYLFFGSIDRYIKYKLKLKKAAERHARIMLKYGQKTKEIGHKTNVILHDGITTKGIDKEIYMAVISMALKQYQEDVHDVESGIITIKPRESHWGGPQFTQKP